MMRALVRSRTPWLVGVTVALILGGIPGASGHLVWENRGQAAFGGFALDAASEGRVLVTSGAVFDDQFNWHLFVRAHDRITGATLWEDELDPDIAVFDWANTVAVDQGRAFAAALILRDDTGWVFAVRAYDLKTGALLWDQRVSHMLGGDTAKVVAAHDGRVFVGGYFQEEVGGFNFALRAFDGRTGAPLWDSVIDSGGSDAAWSVMTWGNRVFVAGDFDGFTPNQSLLVRALVASTGAVIWEKRVPGASNIWAEEDALATDGRFVFATGTLEDSDFVVQAFDAGSGDLGWSARIEVGDGRLSQGLPVVTSAGRLFAAGVRDCDPVFFVECKLFLHAFDASTGSLLWRDTNQSPGNDWQVNGLTAVGGRVFLSGARLNAAGDYSAVIRGYDAKTGSLTWEDDFDGGGTAFDSVYDLLLDSGRLFALGSLSNPDGYSDFFVRAYQFGSHGDQDDAPDNER